MTDPTPLELMQYADGELDPEHAQRIAAWLSESEDAHLQVEGIGQVGELLRAHVEAQLPDIDVLPAVREAVSGGQSGRVVPLRASPRSRPSRLGVLWPMAAALSAAAAVALLVTGRAESPSPVASVSRLPTTSTGSADLDQPPLEQEGALGASVETLDPGGSGATLFVVQAGAVTTPVVWLLDDAEESGDRIGPL